MIDIIVITYNAKSKLKHCFKSVERYTKDTRYSLTVVNNNSTDGTYRFLKNYQKKNRNINIINIDKNLGFSGGANIALKNTFNKFIVLLDDDVEVTEGWLHKLYKQIKNKRKVGIVGCKVVFPNNKIFCTNILITNKMLEEPDEIYKCYEIDKCQRDYLREADAVVGSCWLMRRELIEKVGFFDERFFPSQYEDIDYCLRTRLAGYKIIYNGKVKIIHHNLLRNGGRKQNRKNWQRFLRKWGKTLPKFPLKDSHVVDKYIAKGIDCLKNKKFKQALVEFKKAESIDKRFSEPIYMGIALERIGKYNEAIQQFKKFLSLNPSSFEAHYRLALIYRKIGLIKEAKREASRTFGFIRNFWN